PRRAARFLALLPERRPRFQVIHQKFRGGKRRLAVARRRDHEHDRLTRSNPSVAVDHSHPEERPARLRLLDVARDLGLRHARIMFERECGDRFAIFVGAAKPGEGNHRADIGARAREPRRLGSGVKTFALQADGRGHRQFTLRLSPRKRGPSLFHFRPTWIPAFARMSGEESQPPVIGGKNAISPAPSIRASDFTWLLSIAARMVFGFSKA